MLGSDVKYFNNLDDEQLIDVASREQRTLLTRDLHLYQRAIMRGVDVFLIKGEAEAEKLSELARKYNIRLEINVDESRCPKCNMSIKPISKEEIIDKIPESTSRFYEEFWICLGCGKIYWQGSHWKKINKTLQQARQIMESPAKEFTAQSS